MLAKTERISDTMKFSAVTVAAMAISSVLAKDRQYTTEITYTSDGATKTYTSTHKTHKYGKFNNTHHEKPTTEVEIKVPENDASGNRMNSMKLFGLTTGTAVVAGALMLL